MDHLKILKLNNEEIHLKITLGKGYTFKSTNTAFSPYRRGGKLLPTKPMIEYKKYLNDILTFSRITLTPGIKNAKWVKTTYTFYINKRFAIRDLTNLLKYPEDLIHKKLDVDDNKVIECSQSKIKTTENESLVFTLKVSDGP